MSGRSQPPAKKRPADLVPCEWAREIPFGLPPPPNAGAWVYFILCDSPEPFIKIGFATKLQHRLGNAQSGCPFELRLVAWFHSSDPRFDEAALHERFVVARSRGEWFSLNDELRDFISKLRAAQRLDLRDVLLEAAP